MKDGIYDFHFTALNRHHRGSIEVRDNVVEGGDPAHAIRGQLSRAGTNLVASFEVNLRGGDAPRAGYQLKMSGTGTASEFNVIGLAPLGLIVEVRGTWRAPLADAAPPRPALPSPATRRPPRQ